MKKVLIAMCVLFSTVAYADNAIINIYGGKAVSNSVSDVKSPAWGIEQETPTKLGVWEFGYLNEGHQLGDKRDGIYALPKFAYKLTPKVETSFAIGPYLTSTTITEADGVHYQDHYRWAVLGNVRARYSITENWGVFGEWGHVMYRRDNKDADLFAFGVSKKF